MKRGPGGATGGREPWDLFLVKFSGDLSSVLCATYHGSSSEDRTAYGFHVFPNGEPVMTAFYSGGDMPTAGTFSDGLANTFGGFQDAGIFRLSSDCSSFVWSRYLGGSERDTPRGGFVAEADTIWLNGESREEGFGPVDFPTTTGALYETPPGGGGDGWITKLGADGSVLASTMLGGSNAWDQLIGVYPSGDRLYFDVRTSATNFPVTGDAAQSSSGGGSGVLGNEVAVGWMGRDLTTLEYATYLGGSDNEYGEVYPTVSDGVFYVPVGEVSSTDFPTTAGAYDETFNGGWDCALTAYDTSDGSVIWSTYLGGSGEENCYNPTVLPDGNILLIGYTSSTDFPTTASAYQGTFAGGSDDGVLMILSPDGSQLLYSTYIGGSGRDRVRGVYYDTATGDIYLVGETQSTDLPMAGPSFDNTYNGGQDGFILRFESTTPTSAGEGAELSQDSLLQSYPNPFRGARRLSTPWLRQVQ